MKTTKATFTPILTITSDIDLEAYNIRWALPQESESYFNENQLTLKSNYYDILIINPVYEFIIQKWDDVLNTYIDQLITFPDRVLSQEIVIYAHVPQKLIDDSNLKNRLNAVSGVYYFEHKNNTVTVKSGYNVINQTHYNFKIVTNVESSNPKTIQINFNNP